MAQSDLIMRRAAAGDIPDILRMLSDDVLGKAREVVTDPPDEAYQAAFRAIDEDKNQFLAVAEMNGRVVGTVQLSFLPGMSHHGAWRAQIEAVRVDGSARGEGLGHRMIGWAIDEARARGCRMVQLTSNATRSDARRFYESLGFEATHIGYKLTLQG